MRVFYDYQILLMQNYGGISRYFYEILTRMPEGYAQIEAIRNQNLYFADYYNRPIKPINGGSRYSRIISKNRKNTLKLLKKTKEEFVFHPTYYNPYFIEQYEGKLVVTVHDMIHEKFPEYYGGNATILHKKSLVERADAIVAVSQATKDDMLTYYPNLNPENIYVVHHGTSTYSGKLQDDNMEQRFLDGYRYVLYVGNRDRYKNFAPFSKALSMLLHEDEKLRLVCVGGGTLSEDELAVFDVANCANRVIQLSATEEQLIWLYQNATCFVFPSKAEGFGIPILEAWVNNCPAIVSDIPCFREVGGDAAGYFDTDDAMDIKKQIEDVIYNNGAEALINRGNIRKEDFGWDKCAKAHMDIYERVLG